MNFLKFRDEKQTFIKIQEPKQYFTRLVNNLITQGMFGTLNVDYIRDSNLYYWDRRHCNGIIITIHKFGCTYGKLVKEDV